MSNIRVKIELLLAAYCFISVPVIVPNMENFSVFRMLFGWQHVDLFQCELKAKFRTESWNVIYSVNKQYESICFAI